MKVNIVAPRGHLKYSPAHMFQNTATLACSYLMSPLGLSLLEPSRTFTPTKIYPN